MKRKQYSVEFKEEAVRLVVMDGLSAPEVAQRLGINPNLLYRWKGKHLENLEASASAQGAGSSPREMAVEMDRLRKRLSKAERINEILKKTVGYFAKDES